MIKPDNMLKHFLNKVIMNSNVKKELIIWGVFIAAIIVVIIPLTYLFHYVGMPKGLQSLVSFVSGMVLMVVSRLLVNKYYDKTILK